MGLKDDEKGFYYKLEIIVCMLAFLFFAIADYNSGMCRCVAGNVSPNSARIGGYNTETMTKADRLTREALGL